MYIIRTHKARTQSCQYSHTFPHVGQHRNMVVLDYNLWWMHENYISGGGGPKRHVDHPLINIYATLVQGIFVNKIEMIPKMYNIFVFIIL